MSVIVVDKELLRSKAFRTLHGNAIVVLMDFLMKRRIKQVKMSGNIKVPMILNNGEIQYSYKEALEHGITKPAFARALDVLIARGFIDIARQGTGGRDRETSLYSISERWRDYGTAKFKTGKPRVKDTRQGVGFARHWKKRKINLGNVGVTGPGNAGVTPKAIFRRVLSVSSNAGVTRKKAAKRLNALPVKGRRGF
jgi:hypothetical protein